MTNQDIEISLARLRDEFIARLPERMAVLKTLFDTLIGGDEAAIAALHQSAHNLVGAAGVYGLRAVSHASRAIENIVNVLPTGRPLTLAEQTALRAAMDQLAAAAINPGDDLLPAPTARSSQPRIVVVDDDADQANWLRPVLENAGYQVQTFTSLEAFRAAALASDAPSAVIMDMVFAQGVDAGARIITELKTGVLEHTPVVFLSVRQDLQSRLAAYRSGAASYLTKPVTTADLLRVMGDIVALAPSSPYQVLLVDDDLDQLAAHAALLRQAGMTVQETDKPLQVLQILQEFAAEVLVLDMYMPQCSGPELAAALRDDKRHADKPIVYLSAETNVFRQLQALGRGGDHFLTKPVDPLHLSAVVGLHAQRYRQVRKSEDVMHAIAYERQRNQQAINAHALVSIANLAGDIIYANDKFCAVSGYSRDELMGQNHRLLKSAEHPPAFFDAMWHTISRGDIWSGELCNRSKDGTPYWVESTIIPFVDDNGLPYQYISIRTDITRVIQSQTDLRESEADQRALLNAFPGFIAAIDNNFIYTFANERLAALVGLPAPQIIGRHMRDVLGEQRFQSHVPEIMRARGGQIAATEQDYPATADHAQLYLEVMHVAGPVQSDGHQTCYVFGLDISQRKRAERDAELFKERLRRGQIFANIGTWEWDIKTGELFWTERIAALFGYPHGELETSYDNFLAAIHQDDRQSVIDAVNACVEYNTLYEIEHRVVWPDGTVRWLLERGATVRDTDGKALSMLGVVQDIDKRKRLELKLIESENHLRESKERFAFAVEGAGDGIWDWRIPSGEMLLSANYEGMLGYATGALTPTVQTWVASVHPDDLPRVQQNLQDYLEDKAPTYVVELRLLCQDDSYKWVLCRGTVVERDASGKPVRMIGIHSDISEQKMAQTALEKSRLDANRANQAKSEFLASMSHELRTPMNAILGFAQILEYDDQLNADQHDNVAEILKGGHHLLELINEVLDLAKIESGGVQLSLEPVDLAALAQDCSRLIEPLAAKRHISLALDVPPGTSVRADRTRLKQVLLNLLSNAVKYNREAGNVRLSVAPAAALCWRIVVTDTGPGIAPERIAELFQPFNRLDAEHSDVEGTGIGLTISRRLMEMMGGAIGVDSQPGVGSTFWIELPTAQTSAIAQTADIKGAAAAPGTSQQVQCVLCIDDNPVNLKLLAQMLGLRKNIHLLTSHTPELGIELALAHRPQLILLDINMPIMDGWQVLKIFKADARLKDIPVLAVTANALPRDIERGRAAGFADYLTKPLNVGQFLNSIDRYLVGSEEQA